MADLLSGTPPTPPTPPPVAGNGPGQPGGSISAPVPAQVSAPLFGGFRGGRPRKDGLKPGSPEALAADREKDRIRKERSRAVARAADPAPLPSAGQAPRPESAASAPAPDLAGWRAGDGGAFIPWESGMLDPLFKQLIPAAEQMTVSQLTTRAAKARLPGELVKDIEQDARWAPPAKKALEMSGPQVAAKWLNKLGLSAENQAEVVFGTAVASILAGHVMLMKKLDKLIVSANGKPAEPAQTEAKP